MTIRRPRLRRAAFPGNSQTRYFRIRTRERCARRAGIRASQERCGAKYPPLIGEAGTRRSTLRTGLDGEEPGPWTPSRACHHTLGGTVAPGRRCAPAGVRPHPATVGGARQDQGRVPRLRPRLARRGTGRPRLASRPASGFTVVAPTPASRSLRSRDPVRSETWLFQGRSPSAMTGLTSSWPRMGYHSTKRDPRTRPPGIPLLTWMLPDRRVTPVPRVTSGCLECCTCRCRSRRGGPGTGRRRRVRRTRVRS